jgi:hypothetical protein
VAKFAIDPTTSFDAPRYFKAIRKAGQNPRLQRLAPGQTCFTRDVNCEDTSVKRALAAAAHEWAATQDPAGAQQAKYLRDLFGVLPAEPNLFELALG